jgi:azurin
MILKFLPCLALGALVATPARAAAETVEVKLEVGDGLKYSKKKIEVSEGSKVKLTLTHTGKMSKEAMGHNFVLLTKGTEMAKFAQRAMGAAKTDYVPKGMDEKVIAHTKLIGGGESDTITFDAPAAGTYTFLCTFPGHYTVMNGKLVVE